jgi:hypothetical protein
MSGRKKQVRSGKILCFTEENFVKRGAKALVKKRSSGYINKNFCKSVLYKRNGNEKAAAAG